MADGAEAGADSQITFKVKTGSDGNHTLTMAESATVLDLKTKLAGSDYENVAVERQRLIYSGRVMKNDDTLATYKIKNNNTIHMVKSAASNPGQPAATSNPTSANQTIPQNMASGTANNPLAGLTGARYAGHQVNLPGMDMFGPDGGMSGGGMDEERLSRMMSDPNVQQSMNEALNNPDFVNMLIDANPMLRNMPNARELITSPLMRQMMTDPQMMNRAMRMQRSMGGGNAAFPAPGATNTSEGATGGTENTGNGGNEQQNPFGNPFANPFMPPGMFGGDLSGAESGGMPNLSQLMHLMNASGSGMPDFLRGPPQAAGTTGGTQTNPAAPASGERGTSEGQTATPGQDATSNAQNQQAANPFAALFPPSGGNQANPFGMTPEMMQQMMAMFGGGAGGGAPAASPPDNRPPEERYADQLRQLNDMGFFDFDRNVAALRRAGGSVQGAIEHLLSGS